jgi:hypothetical protein
MASFGGGLAKARPNVQSGNDRPVTLQSSEGGQQAMRSRERKSVKNQQNIKLEAAMIDDGGADFLPVL